MSDFQKDTDVLFDFLMEFYSSFLKFVKTKDESSLNKDFVKLYKKYPKANERIIVDTLDKIESVRGYFKVNANHLRLKLYKYIFPLSIQNIFSN